MKIDELKNTYFISTEGVDTPDWEGAPRLTKKGDKIYLHAKEKGWILSLDRFIPFLMEGKTLLLIKSDPNSKDIENYFIEKGVNKSAFIYW